MGVKKSGKRNNFYEINLGSYSENKNCYCRWFRGYCKTLKPKLLRKNVKFNISCFVRK